MTVAETVTGSGALTTPELIPLLDEAAEAATILRDRAVEAVAAKVSPGRQDRRCRARARAARRPRPGLDRHLCRGACASLRAMRGAWRGRAGSARWRACSPRSAPREYLSQLSGGVMMSQGETARLHELGVKEADQTAFLTPAVRALIQGATPETRARVVELIKESQGTADLRRYRPRRDAASHPRRDAPLLRSRSRAACARLAPERRICADAADRPDERARRVLAHAARGVWRARPRQGGDVRRLRGAVAAAISASARSARARRSPRS